LDQKKTKGSPKGSEWKENARAKKHEGKKKRPKENNSHKKCGRGELADEKKKKDWA